MLLDFPGLAIEMDDEALIVRSKKSLSMLSTAVMGGGFISARHIVNRHVGIDYDCQKPEEDLMEFARRRQINEPFVGMMTAVAIKKARFVTEISNQVKVAAIVTAGLGNLTSAGLSLPALPRPGTINIIILTDAFLTPPAMVNAITTATEAKTHFVLGRHLSTTDGHKATGTSTDAITLGCLETGLSLKYAGPATAVGWAIGRCVRQALQGSLD